MLGLWLCFSILLVVSWGSLYFLGGQPALALARVIRQTPRVREQRRLR